jgi:hypothetical protein
MNPLAKDIGYVFLLRKEQAAETEMFRFIEEKARRPIMDSIKKKMGLDPNDVAPWGRSVIMMDGGMTQLAAAKDQACLAEKVK